MTEHDPSRREMLKIIAASGVGSTLGGCTALLQKRAPSYRTYLTDQERLAPSTSTQVTVTSPNRAATEETLGPFRAAIMNYEYALMRELPRGRISRSILGQYYTFDVEYTKEELIETFSESGAFQESYKGYEIIHRNYEPVAVTEGQVIKPGIDFDTREMMDIIDRVNGDRKTQMSDRFTSLADPLSAEFFMTLSFGNSLPMHIAAFVIDGLEISEFGQSIQITGDELTVTSTVRAEEPPKTVKAYLDEYDYQKPYNDVGIVRYASPDVTMNDDVAIITETRPAEDFLRTAAR